MKRIYPFYKNQDLSKKGLGYSSINSAKKFMNQSLIIEDFNKLFSDDYWFEHFYVYKLETKKSYYPNRWGGFANPNMSIDYQEDYNNKFYLPELPEDIKKIVIEYFNFYYKEWYKNRNWTDNNLKIRLDELSLQLVNKGYGPHLYKDDKDYKKKLSKYIKENVEFKEMDVEIVIK